MANPIAEMAGPQFLFLYGTVIVLTLGICWWRLRSSDPTASMPVPLVPSKPDPYEIAYLRGGENELTRVVLVSLTQRPYLRVTEEEKSWWQSKSEQQIERAPNHADPRHLSPLERSVFGWFSGPRTAKDIFESEGLPSKVQSYGTSYEQRLQNEQLLTLDEVKGAAWRIGLVGAAVIAGLGGYKLLVALAKGRSNVYFLIIMGIVSLVILHKICAPGRLSSRGRAYLKRLESAFEGLKERASMVSFGAWGDTTLPLLVGVFGVGALAGTSLDYYGKMFQASKSGYYGAGCGSCGGGGGGCGGGCGGCGG